MRTSILFEIVAAVALAASVGCGSSSTTVGDDAGGDGGATLPDAGKPPKDAGTRDEGTAPPFACNKTAPAPTRGSAIALGPDDTRLVVVNRDVGTATILRVAYDANVKPVLTKITELPVGNEPWQVVVDACGANAYVVLRKDQKVVAIRDIDTDAPTVGASASVGSEPASLALTPNNTQLYVSNWVDGTVTVLDPQTMTVTRTIDLNATIAATGLLGPDVQKSPRPALAHPRGIAVTNNGDANDQDETVYVTEWFAVRTAPESLTPAPTATTASVSDTNWNGLLYTFPVKAGKPSSIFLPPVASTGFADANGNATGCFPNQVASVTINGAFAYVTSTCASPAGPVGVFQKGQCSVDAECNASNASSADGAVGSCVNGACAMVCTMDPQCGVGSVAGACNLATGVCAPLAINAKTTTHPAVTIVKLAGNAATTSTLDTLFTTTSAIGTGTSSTRMPLLPTDLDFKGSSAYVAAEGADAVFRLVTSKGTISQVGSSANDFIDLGTSDDRNIRLPIGVAVSQTHAFAFVADDGDRNVEAIDLDAQAVAVGPSGTDFRVLASSALPKSGADLSRLDGKRGFTTGLGRWSLGGAAWGSCAACHLDGLSDNVTWYFARGPRQSISLDGTFNSADPTDQRIMNWTAILDEIADLEANVRGISGGVGAIVQTLSTPPVNTDRVNLFSFTPNQQGLEGSNTDIANPDSGTTGHSVLATVNWADIQSYIANVRSPRAPTNLVSADVKAGAAIFSGSGNCIGCHSGGKWTLSTLFYTPGDVPNDAFPGTGPSSLSETTWSANLNDFPSDLFPSAASNGQQDMRSGAPPTFEQLQCALRPVGTILANGAVPTGVSPAAVNVQEVRQNMTTGAQGAGGVNANDFTAGFNPPALLGLQVGAPYFHAGNARSLEEAFSGVSTPTSTTPIFAGHYASAVAPAFSPTATERRQLVAFLLSIDEGTAPLAIPPLSAKGGSLCQYGP